MFVMAPFVVTWNCWISYKNEYAGPLLAASLEPLGHRPNVASLSLSYRYYFARCSSKLAQVVRFPYSRGGLLVILINWMVFLSPFLDVVSMSMSTVSCLAQLDSGTLCL